MNYSFEYNSDWDPQVPGVAQHLVGKGTYGIAFFPGFPCDTNYQPSNYIGKVFLDNEAADKEWEIAQKIKRLADTTTQKYFMFSEKRCDILLNTNPTTPAERELIEYFKENDIIPLPQKVQQHFMKYAGVTLIEYVKKMDRLTIVELIQIVENLFYGIKFLKKNGYTHCDLKYENVVVSNTKRLRIIDFGYTVHKDNYYNDDNVLFYYPYFYVSAPENIAWVFRWKLKNRQQKISFDDYMHYIRQHKKEEYDKYMSYFVNRMVEIQADFTAMVNKIAGVSNEQAGMDYLKSINSHEKQDVFSIGLILMRLVVHSKNIVDDNQTFKQLIEGMLYPVPEKRFTIEQSIDHVKILLQNAGPSPFETNRDPQEMQDIFAQKFGKTHDNKLEKLLKYINTLL